MYGNRSQKVKFLVIGCGGLIGSALVQSLKNANESFLCTSRKKDHPNGDCFFLDLTEEQADWKEIGGMEAAIFCAGITNADFCENNRLLSKLVNVDNTFKLAGMLADKGAHIVYLSSNAVFNGEIELPSHDDPVSPVTEYGRQKAEAEKLLLDSYPSGVTVLRLTKVLGPAHPLFSGWVDSLRKGQVIHPFSDMYIAPIPVSFVVSAVRLIVARKIKGVLHLSGDEDISYADIALMAADWICAKRELIVPIRASESNLPRSMVRTSKTALDASRTRLELGITPPPSRWTLKQAFLSILNGALTIADRCEIGIFSTAD